jgi:4-hydroxybenzoyl-CoA thioesterase
MEPFRRRHRVGFGECDPARIFFAPRAIDWSTEAVEAYCDATLGLSWTGLLAQGREVKVLAVDCAYERSAAASQELALAVEPVAVAPEALTIGVVAELAPGQVSFRAKLELALVERGERAPLPLPPELLARVAAGGLAAAPPPHAPHRAREAPRAGPGAPTFTRSRRVRYGDCGPSGAIHAPRVADWAVELVGEWYEEQLGISWIEQCRRGRGTPFLAIRVELPGRMQAGQLVTMDVSIPRLGKASIGYAVVGRDERGVPCFEADMSACYITEEAGPPRSMPFPDELRARILEFQAGAPAGRS